MPRCRGRCALAALHQHDGGHHDGDAQRVHRVLALTPPTKRVLGVAPPNSPTKEAARFARYLCRTFSYKDA